MHFARTVAHTMQVDDMLDGLEPWQFKEWVAMFNIRPWGIEPTAEAEDREKPSALSTMRGLAGV